MIPFLWWYVPFYSRAIVVISESFKYSSHVDFSTFPSFIVDDALCHRHSFESCLSQFAFLQLHVWEKRKQFVICKNDMNHRSGGVVIQVYHRIIDRCSHSLFLNEISQLRGIIGSHVKMSIESRYYIFGEKFVWWVLRLSGFTIYCCALMQP
jgi:hypothetical protein